MIYLTQQNFAAEVKNETLPVLIEFSNKTSLPAELEKNYRQKCKFCRVDMNAQAEFAGRFSLLRLPTSILMQNGDVIQRISGERSAEEWKKILNLD